MTGSEPHKLRLSYLDGLRAAAALYVVLFHAVLGFAVELSGPYRALRLVFGFGHEAVAIFIVLSGYCLMLPVARAPDNLLAGGFWGYLGRRALRILPPYFAALAVSLLLIRYLPVLGQGGTGTIWDDSLPGIGLWPIASHLLLFHNWFPEWAYQINGPLWSVASEWQIYFFFPLLLLPIWRRSGVVMVLMAAVIGYAPLLFAREGALRAVPWYLLLFGLGMLAAGIGFADRGPERWLRSNVSWSKLSFGLWLACAVGGTLGARIWFRFLPLTDLLVGSAAAALLVHCTSQLQAGAARGPVLRALESRLLVGIGHFSYSLYLTHLPIVALCFFGLRGLGVASAPVLAVAMMASALPASLLVAYAFYWLVERHFIKARPKRS
jgi:peptidoglycan/LPS O-acetylase OafA/YrhL